jgi:hypothetical protein
MSSTLAKALGEEGARELRARGADMDWDQALAYTSPRPTQALNELQSATPAMSELPLDGADIAYGSVRSRRSDTTPNWLFCDAEPR